MFLATALVLSLLPFLGAASAAPLLEDETSAPAVETAITVQPAESGLAVGSMAATLLAEPLITAATKGVVTQRFELMVPGMLRLPLATDMAWRLSLETPGYWSPELVLPPRDAEDDAVPRLRLFPTGDASGQLETNEVLPTNITLRFRAAGRGPEEPIGLSGELSCPVVKGRFRCPLPAGRWDIRLRAEGFISHFLWNLDVKPREENSVGTFLLERGAAVAGWVRREDDAPIGEGCKAILEPEIGPRSTPQLAAKAEDLSRAIEVDERGFFQLKGIQPGAHTVVARQKGFAPARSAPLTLAADSDMLLAAPLLLRRPIDLEVTVVPSHDPNGQPWKIQALDARRHDLAASGSADREGRFGQALEPGVYYLTVSDAGGTRLAFEEIEFDHRQTSFFIELAQVAVEGRVTLGDVPLAATLAFGGRSGAVSISLHSDDEGRFTGVLPRDGKWKVDVMAPEPHVFRRLGDVEVVSTAGTEVAQVEIALPDSFIEGVVVESSGEPTARALVLATFLPGSGDDRETPEFEKPFFTQIDAEGGFAFHGLRAGRYRLEAQWDGPRGKRQSDTAEVSLEDDSSPDPVRLVLQDLLRISGRLVAPGGSPVPGAEVNAQPLRPVGTLQALAMPSARAGVDGSFTLDLPPDSERIDLTVLAPGFLLLRASYAVAPGTELVVPLQQNHGGTLELGLGDATNTLGPTPYLVLDETFTITYHDLMRWSRLNGAGQHAQALIVPQLPAGTYDACWPQPQRKTSADGQDSQECTSRFLPPLGRIVLSPTTHGSSEEKGSP